MSGYKNLLRTSSEKSGNCACMGLDVQYEVIEQGRGDVYSDVVSYFEKLLNAMVSKNLSPAAFKPNIGYYSVLDSPREGSFPGSQALSDILDMVESLFPGIPVILDSKRGDIARSSLNYASEAFDCWKSDAVTVSPYMGSDSVFPFLDAPYNDKGVYLLDRTSNPGSKDFQMLDMLDTVEDNLWEPLYIGVIRQIATWARKAEGIGAVVGATHLEELKVIASLAAPQGIPLLIPGVGSQGASATETIDALRASSYPVEMCRINSSSALTHPWKKGTAPGNWLDLCIGNIEKLFEETSL